MNFATMTDADIALHFLRLIPSGRWTNYGEIAECVMAVTPEQKRTLTGYRVAMMLLHAGANEHWWRLRDAQGVFNVPAHESRNHATVQNDFDQNLRDEGCAVSGHRADKANHISAQQLLASTDVPSKPAPTVLSAEAQRRVDERVAERVARLNKGS